MGDRAQLGHASGLHSGQAVPTGERWHGSPAQRTDVNYLRVPSAQASTWRRAVYSTAAVLVVLLLCLPLLAGGATLAIDGASSLAQALDPSAGEIGRASCRERVESSVGGGAREETGA